MRPPIVIQFNEANNPQHSEPLKHFGDNVTPGSGWSYYSITSAAAMRGTSAATLDLTAHSLTDSSVKVYELSSSVDGNVSRPAGLVDEGCSSSSVNEVLESVLFATAVIRSWHVSTNIRYTTRMVLRT